MSVGVGIAQVLWLMGGSERPIATLDDGLNSLGDAWRPKWASHASKFDISAMSTQRSQKTLLKAHM